MASVVLVVQFGEVELAAGSMQESVHISVQPFACFFEEEVYLNIPDVECILCHWIDEAPYLMIKECHCQSPFCYQYRQSILVNSAELCHFL